MLQHDRQSTFGLVLQARREFHENLPSSISSIQVCQNAIDGVDLPRTEGVYDRTSVTAQRLLGIFVFLTLVGVVHAQTGTGLISGTISDPSKAVVTGANVVALEVHTQSVRRATANADGIYSFSQLQPGDYEISIDAAGFGPFVARVQVSVGARITVDAALSVGTAQTNATVVAEGGVQVETQTPMLSDVINGQQITQLPTLTRNPYDLVLLAGNISPGDPFGRGVGVAINGQRATSTNIMLDGGENTNAYLTFVGQAVPLDSVKEFRISQSTFTAEYGRASGGMVDVETRSGTNDFHGSLYEFNRVSKLAANTYDNSARGFPRGVFTRNQFGYALGGPILKDRLFFFQSTEWTRVRSEQTVFTLVPTPEYIAASAPATQAYFTKFGGSGDPVNGPILPRRRHRRWNPAESGRAFRSASVECAGSWPGSIHQCQGRGRWRTLRTLTASGRTLGFQCQRENENLRSVRPREEICSARVSFSSPYPGYDEPFTSLSKNALAGLTHVFSPTLVSLTKFGFNRLDQQFPLGTAPAGPVLFFRTISTCSGSARRCRATHSPRKGITQYGWQISQDLTWTRGKHLLRLGGEFLNFRHVVTGFAGAIASQSLGRQSADALDNFLAGQLQGFQVAIDPQGKFPCSTSPDGNPIVTPACTLTLPLQSPSQARTTCHRDGAAYVQDTWRLRKALDTESRSALGVLRRAVQAETPLQNRIFISVQTVRSKCNGRKIPQIAQYLVAARLPVKTARDVPWFYQGVAEIWLADEAAQLASLQSPEFLQGARLGTNRAGRRSGARSCSTPVRTCIKDDGGGRPPPEYAKLYVLLKRRPDACAGRVPAEVDR